MRGWSSFVAGFLLLALAYWLYTLEGFGSEAIICGVAAAALLLQGAFGREVGGVDGATDLLDFIQDPADAIVDSATDRLGDWLGDREAAQEPARGTGTNHRQALVDWLHDREEPQASAAAPAAAPAATPAPPIVVQPLKVVAEGAMARYFAQREAELAASAAQAPVRGFGRKGL